ncbi:MAG: hypothetical protein R2684_14780 [Pyrinomonadaceae bacterium]
MKAIFRVSVLGLVLFALVGFTATASFAQTDEKAELYQKYTDNYAGDINQRRIAVEAAKEFIKRYENSADDKAIIDYLKGALPALEQGIADEQKAIDEYNRKVKEAEEQQARLNALDAAMNAKEWKKVFQTGQAVIDAHDPAEVDVVLVLAGVGNTLMYEKQDQFNQDALKYAQMAIKMIESGKKSSNDQWGAYNYSFGSSDNALGWLNYYVGYTKQYRMSDTAGAIPYFFKALNSNSDKKNDPDAYRVIGAWYITRSKEVTDKRNATLEERNAETKAETPDEEKIKSLDARIDELVAMEKGFAERAIDAYSRAYANVAEDQKSSQYATNLFNSLKNLYQFRWFDKPERASEANIKADLAMINSKSMPDPESTVQPVFDNKTPAATETTTSGATRSRTAATKTDTASNNR